MARGTKVAATPPAAIERQADGDGVERIGTTVSAGDGEALIEGDGTGETLPPADEDHTTEFDRRVERLTEIAMEAEFVGGTLVGDIRDAMLDLFKHRPKAWSQMSADEMRDVGKGLETIAKTLIRKIVLVVAEEDDVSVPATLKGYSVKGDTFQLKIEAKGDVETATELFRMDGHDVVILRADAKRFHGQKRDAEVIDDQASMTFADPEPKAAADHPADDADLAGEDDELPPAPEGEDDEIIQTPEGFGAGDDD